MKERNRVDKVVAIEAALELIELLKLQHAELMFHQLGGTFSLEGPEGKAFRIRSGLFANEEWRELVVGKP